MIRSRRRARAPGAALLVAVLLAGCATPRAPEVPEADGTRAWNGRFAATWMLAGAAPQEDRASGRFQLRALGDATEMEIVSPFGQTLMRASARPGLATIETADGRSHQAANPQALTEALLGWRVPIERLPRWLAGEFGQSGGSPDGAGEVRAVDDGWLVTAAQWAGGRPLRLTLRWPSETRADDARRVEIRLAVDADANADAR